NRRLPSGENATQVTCSVCPSKLRALPVSRSQRRISSSLSPEPPPRLLPASKYFPSGEKAHLPLEPVLYIPTCFTLAISHRRTEPSMLPQAARLPSGEMATPATSFVWPLKRRSSRRLSAARSRRSLSLPSANLF